MKNLTIILLALTMLFGIIGCADEKQAASSDPTLTVPVDPGSPFVPDGTGPGQGPGANWEWGAQATLDIVNLSTMADYTARSMNNPTDIKVNVNLTKIGSAYGGVITIAYIDNGQAYEGYFTSRSSVEDNQYNIFFTKNDKKVWHGIFEDFFGGLIVVIDEVVDLGDGEPVTNVNGSVWFKNFGLTYAPQSPTPCWRVSLGPYDCRSWKSGEGINTTAAVNPTDGYIKLGTFTGLNFSQAFNGQAEL